MNLDRFGFKARDYNDKVWLSATLKSGNGIAYEVEWGYETNKEPVFPTAWIKPETICQCTGIRDSEGRLIYEHDIIEIRDTKDLGFVENAEIIWNENEWGKDNGTVNSIGGLMRLYKDGRVTIKVIGNKFDKEVNDGKLPEKN